MAKSRLDTLLAARGLFVSRSRAAAAVMAGEVRIAGSDGFPKPGQMVADDVTLDIAEGRQYVSRGGVKLANALDAFAFDPGGRRCLDVGASTGGFTDCLLRRGADSVIALDVAYGELALVLREDPRVTVIERTNARSLDPAALPWEPEVVVCDVSFIGLEKVLPAVLACASPGFDCLALVKPQFEAGRARVGRGGVVRSAPVRRETLVSVGRAVRDGLGLGVLGFAPSGLPGPAGNRETFVWICEAGREGVVEDIEAAAQRAEP